MKALVSLTTIILMLALIVPLCQAQTYAIGPPGQSAVIWGQPQNSPQILTVVPTHRSPYYPQPGYYQPTPMEQSMNAYNQVTNAFIQAEILKKLRRENERER